MSKSQERNICSLQTKRLKERLQNIRASINGLNGKLPECFRWKVDCPYPHALILAGDVLFAGGDNSVAAFSIKDGSELWNTSVKGKTTTSSIMLISIDHFDLDLLFGLYLPADHFYFILHFITAIERPEFD